MYVCMCVCVYVCMYVCMYVFMQRSSLRDYHAAYASLSQLTIESCGIWYKLNAIWGHQTYHFLITYAENSSRQETLLLLWHEQEETEGLLLCVVTLPEMTGGSEAAKFK
jgi:hypothetical protein